MVVLNIMVVMAMIIIVVMLVMFIMVIRTDRKTKKNGQTGQTDLTFKLHFPGNLCRAAFAILATFLSIVPCTVQKSVYIRIQLLGCCACETGTDEGC